MKQRNRIIDLIIIILIGLTPLLWFKGNQVILGHDAGLSLAPVLHFFDRFFVWTDKFGFGSDQSFALPGLFIHGLEALIYQLTQNLQLQQKILFCFWMILPGLSMYYFASKLANKFGLLYLALPTSVFYMFNHFLLQGWLIAERTKFSVYAALPLIISLLFDWLEQKRSNVKTAVWCSLILFILNGAGSLPLFGGLIVTVLFFFLYFLLINHNKNYVFAVIKLSFLIIFFSLLLNAYWIAPYLYYLSYSFAGVVKNAGGVEGVVLWISYISANSSLINLLRLQGIPEWYQNLTHPYSGVFLKNPFMILISFLIPVLAILPIQVYKSLSIKKHILFFLGLALFAVIFVAGSHEPFGPIYILLVKFIPGFLAFRTPYYKFAPALWFSYSILIGFSVSYLLTKLSGYKKNIIRVLMPLTILAILFYSFPLLGGSFFDYIKNERSMRVTVPDYIYDFSKWSESEERKNIKTLALPEPAGNVDTYTWGYWSLQPLTSLLTNSPVINLSYYTSSEQSQLLSFLYKKIRNNESDWQEFARLLGINSILLRKDFAWNSSGSLTYPPSAYYSALNSTGVDFIKSFGNWDVYDLTPKTKNLSLFSNVAILNGKVTDLGIISSLPGDLKNPVFIYDNYNENIEAFEKYASEVYIKPVCQRCDLLTKYIDDLTYTPLFTPESFLYPLIKFYENINSNRDKGGAFYINDVYKSLSKALLISKVLDLKSGNAYINTALSNHSSYLDKLLIQTRSYLSDRKQQTSPELLDIYDILIKEKKVFLENAKKIYNSDSLEALYTGYKKLNELIILIDNNLWQTSNENQKRYITEIPYPLEYNFVYRSNDNKFNVGKSVKLMIDGKKYEIKPVPGGNDWYSLGSFGLSKGIHKFEIEQQSVNLMQNDNSAVINNNADGKCWYSREIRGEKGDVFKINFLHRLISGQKNFIVRLVNSNIDTNPFDKGGINITSNYYWENYPKDLVFGDADTKYYLAVCSIFEPDLNSLPAVMEIKDLNIRKISVPDLLLYAIRKTSSYEIPSEYNKISQTKYELKTESVNKPAIMVLNETYNNNWKTDINSQNLTINGYANGWIIDNVKNTINVEYASQKIFRIGMLVSACVFIGFIISLFLRKR